MGSIKADELLSNMLQAAQKSLSAKWPQVRDLAAAEFGKYAHNLEAIRKMKRKGTISREQARLQLDIQRNSIKTVLLTEKGLGLLAVEAAINAAMDAVRETVNKAIGWGLL